MNRFFFISFMLLLVAVVVTVGVWYVLQISLKRQVEQHTEVLQSTTPEDIRSQSDADIVNESIVVEEEYTPPPVPEESIMLREFPLTDSQRSMIEAVGIDVETYIITPEMIACAKTELGIERYNAIIGGATPGFIEGTKLLGCMQ